MIDYTSYELDLSHIIHRVKDDSYVVTADGYPYHVPNEGDYVDFWKYVNEYVQEHPEVVEDEYPPTPPTEEEIYDGLCYSVRGLRDAKLKETDYLMLADVPISQEDKEAIMVYRQELRDITDQEGFPEDVVWPELHLSTDPVEDEVSSDVTDDEGMVPTLTPEDGYAPTDEEVEAMDEYLTDSEVEDTEPSTEEVQEVEPEEVTTDGTADTTGTTEDAVEEDTAEKEDVLPLDDEVEEVAQDEESVDQGGTVEE